MSSRYSLCIAACLILFAMAPPAMSQNQTTDWSLVDTTGVFELGAVEAHDSAFTVSLKNKSASVVTAIAFSFKPGTNHYMDWFSSEETGLEPGRSFSATSGPEESADRKMHILAVLFDDGSGKGEIFQMDRMNFHRFGQILEATRIRDILQSRRQPENDTAIGELGRKIGKMPASADEALGSLKTVRVPGLSLAEIKSRGEKLQEALFWGVSITREGVLRHIENARKMPTVSADEKAPSRASFLSFLQDVYDRQNQKGIALLQRMKGGR